jgi:hypothetical protein
MINLIQVNSCMTRNIVDKLYNIQICISQLMPLLSEISRVLYLIEMKRNQVLNVIVIKNELYDCKKKQNYK